MLVLPEDYARNSNPYKAGQRAGSSGRPPGSSQSTRSGAPGTPNRGGGPGTPSRNSASHPVVSTPQPGQSASVSRTSSNMGSIYRSSSIPRGSASPVRTGAASPSRIPAPPKHSSSRQSLGGGEDDESYGGADVYRTASQRIAEDLDSELLDNDAMPQAVEILATLASLGISEQLRSRVQDALSQLEQASADAASALGAPPPAAPSAPQAAKQAGKGGPPGRVGELTAARKIESLEEKLQMSRSIMRKLYHRNVSLEKELQILKANASPFSFADATAELLQQYNSTGSSGGGAGPGDDTRPPTSLTAAAQGQSPVAHALQERDRAIMQLQQALDASRRRCALLESQLGSGAAGGPGGKGKGGGKQEGLKEILVQSQLHFQKYKQIRDDYHRLLYKRASSVQNGKAASAATKQVVDDMQERLRKEIAEREAEAALYSARLYEQERMASDWYVEKKMLEEHIGKLNEEIAQRDTLDQEIERCVCGLFERLKLLEGANEQLRSKLTEAGISMPDGLAMSGLSGGMSGDVNVLSLQSRDE